MQQGVSLDIVRVHLIEQSMRLSHTISNTDDTHKG